MIMALEFVLYIINCVSATNFSVCFNTRKILYNKLHEITEKVKCINFLYEKWVSLTFRVYGPENAICISF